ncbi:hypothetical protein ACFVUN_26475 [Kitasatospora griseola]|uniref:hypothetical protein n=1 Tax=Kitasatospora griseola TaxID=2064 RepID=UPI0036DB733D
MSTAQREAVVAGDPHPAMVPRWWTVGRIVSKNLSSAVIETRCQVAKVLDVRVQGDDGECCGA